MEFALFHLASLKSHWRINSKKDFEARLKCRNALELEDLLEHVAKRMKGIFITVPILKNGAEERKCRKMFADWIMSQKYMDYIQQKDVKIANKDIYLNGEFRKKPFSENLQKMRIYCISFI